ncbi:hypothetical protein J8L70_02220 [Pseudoalteromonas sp. MMG010]|uniref:hypothetical protein n=1 Tax=Pseudoalteromonas sp. MMG010 TaxID=2822685 RepID=UPI001B3A60C6|nr:hypothetical protein [Pseudoalteromonas sp. MMG010]MBQ4832048.1 hypothetical protein [Pseudoalteromonas sp. MMG010]
MSELINLVKSAITELTDGELKCEHTPNTLKFTLNQEHYIFSSNDTETVDCVVVFLTDEEQPFAIDEELEAILDEKINLDQDQFKIGIHKFAHITWQIAADEVAVKVKEIVKNSPVIAKQVLKIITDCMADSTPTQTTQAESSKQSEVKHSVSDVITCAFTSRDWKYKTKEGDRFILYTGFATENYVDEKKDNSLSIRIIYDNKPEVVFSTPFIYNLSKNVISKQEVLDRQIKLGLLNLKLTSSIKFITTAYDQRDGEVFHEIRIMLNNEQSFSEEQVIRAVNLLRQVADDYSEEFKAIFDSGVSTEQFAKKLYQVDESVIVKTLCEQVFSQDETLKALSEQQFSTLVADIAKITKEKAQLILDKDADTE